MSAGGGLYRRRAGPRRRGGGSPAGGGNAGPHAERLCGLARSGTRLSVKAGPGGVPAGSARRLDRRAAPGRVHSFTGSKSRRRVAARTWWHIRTGTVAPADGHSCAQPPMPRAADPVNKQGELTGRARKPMSLIEHRVLLVHEIVGRICYFASIRLPIRIAPAFGKLPEDSSVCAGTDHGRGSAAASR